jgi:hypothetical protein
VKIIVLLTLAAVLQGAAFAQKIQDPELRNEHAANPKQAQSHKSKAVSTRPVRSKASSAAELAKIEQGGIKTTSTRKRTRVSNHGHPELGSAAQGKNTPLRLTAREEGTEAVQSHHPDPRKGLR